MSRLIVNVARPLYGQFCQGAIKHGAIDVHIISSTNTEYVVDVTVSREDVEGMKRALGLVARGNQWHRVAVEGEGGDG